MLLLALERIDSLSGGDAIVGAGTLALAGFTYRLARATSILERNAARERKRHEREVQGVARLVDGEFGIAEAAHTSARSARGYKSPQFGQIWGVASYPGHQQAQVPQWSSMLPYWATTTRRRSAVRLMVTRLWSALLGLRA